MPRSSTSSLDALPFYRERIAGDGKSRPWTLADLEDFAAASPNDRYAGRVLSDARPKLSMQIEATAEPPVWMALDSGELDKWAGVLSRIYARWGCATGENVAFFEYGSSPLVILSSSGYVGYLRRGAAERLGVNAICNDGVAAMAQRMATIVESVKPAMIVLRRDVIAPFCSAIETAGVSLKGRTRWVAVCDIDGAPDRDEAKRLASTLSVEVHRILRADAAFVLAGECPDCRLFHLDLAYDVEQISNGEIAITTRFAKTCPAVRYNIGAARLEHGGC
ncbi:MAG TPA: hypothetical protein VEF03_02680, partial [Candidatus Binataceae bacterium]|nr:hypothetical protein [Candidatus Binataceae bacterium]